MNEQIIFMNAQQLLLKYWGHARFRPLQEEIIQSVLDGKDTLALMPTGGGKSLCYQIPALMKEGICIVISPLIALMKDQVESLNRKNIKALAVYSGMNRIEIDIALDKAAYGDYKLLYLSPERLKTDLFIERLKKMKVNLLAVDEAHCISQWGHDFRPSYLNISFIRKYIPQVPVLALTASATSLVSQEIRENLELKSPNIFRKSFERKNLIYNVNKSEDKLGQLLKIAKSSDGSGLVYVRIRRKTRDVSDFLSRNGIQSDYYHAGLDTVQRNSKQAAWMTGKIRVMVCTNAFGMGIDKPDVRFVCHLDIPDSLEAYFQEAGRAGRDEKQAIATVFFNNPDLIDLKTFFEFSYPPLAIVKQIYSALGNYFHLAVGSGKDVSFDFNFSDFCNQYELQSVGTYNALKLLEREGYIVLSDALHSPSRVCMVVNNNDLYKFMVENKRYDPFIKLMLRSYSGLFTDFVRIDEEELARRADITTNDVINLLKKLEQREVLAYIPRSDLPKITYITERLDEKQIILSPEVYRNRKKAAEDRLQTVIDYVNSTGKCRSQLLLGYFGETTAPRCGICDVCAERNEVGLTEIEFDGILDQIKPLLKSKEMDLMEIIANVRGYHDNKIIKALGWLADHDKVSIDKIGRYKWI